MKKKTKNTTKLNVPKVENLVVRSAEEYSSKLENNYSLDNDSVSHHKNEFSESVRNLIERGISIGVDRKKFLTVMGASLSMASLNCFKEPAEKIIPYVVRPPESLPGVARYYATSLVGEDCVTPVVVKTNDGKPVKIEGNEAHPTFKGAMNSNSYASIWDLYDPDRLRDPMIGSKAVSWDKAIASVLAATKENTLIISGLKYSPSENKVLNTFISKRKNVELISYDSSQVLGDIVSAEEQLYGKAAVPEYRFEKADLVVSIAFDFLGSEYAPHLNTRRFTQNRKPGLKMNRLVSVESNLSVTGSFADQRISLNSGSELAFALALANTLIKGSKLEKNPSVKRLLHNYSAANVAKVTGVTLEEITKLANEIQVKGSKALVVGGGASAKTKSRGALQIVCSIINEIIASSSVVRRTAPFKNSASTSEIEKIVQKINEGKYTTVIIDQVNPVFDFPSIDFTTALKKVKNVIAIDDHITETSSLASIVLAVSHAFESWSDAIDKGFYYVAQPAIAPLFNSLSAGDIWQRLNASKKSIYDEVRVTAKIKTDKPWNALLKDGFGDTDDKIKKGKLSLTALGAIEADLKTNNNYKLTLYKSVSLESGRGANNSFRQELPDPVSKVTWGNYVAISPIAAKKENLKQGDVVEIKSKAGIVKAPIFIQPGLKSSTLAIAIGYGHKKLGQVGVGVGFNALQLTHSKNGNEIETSGIEVTLKATGDSEEIATTQKHGDMHDRKLSKSATLSAYLRNNKAGNEEEKLPGKGLYPPYEYKTYRWAMNIDLNLCTGCSACVTSCYSENNIPVVGKEEILVGREMSWMRIDRYYKGNLENPEVLFQPVLCQHCENAPCENVCPVAATTHSDEGLNDIAYNRCIGTRYCANNCPYKVRRFNFYENWEGKLQDPQQLALNPDVTVRSRGVIEKCSFCVQRINGARQQARVNGKKIKDADLQTACQQGCPSKAITFGDRNNYAKENTKEIVVAEKDDRTYRILDFINVKPMVSYKVRIKNEG